MGNNNAGILRDFSGEERADELRKYGTAKKSPYDPFASPTTEYIKGKDKQGQDTYTPDPTTRFKTPNYYSKKGIFGFSTAGDFNKKPMSPYDRQAAIQRALQGKDIYNKSKVQREQDRLAEQREAFLFKLGALQERAEGRNLASRRMNELALQQGQRGISSLARSGLGGPSAASARMAEYARGDLGQQMVAQGNIDAAREQQQARMMYGKGMEQLMTSDIARQVFEQEKWNNLNDAALKKAMAENVIKQEWERQAQADKEHIRGLNMQQLYDVLNEQSKEKILAQNRFNEGMDNTARWMNVGATALEGGSKLVDSLVSKYKANKAAEADEKWNSFFSEDTSMGDIDDMLEDVE
jgi:hypothetical protein